MSAPTQITADWPLQQAMYAALNGALSTTIIDHMPHDEALPVIVIGDVFSSDWSTTTTRGQVITARVHVVSEYEGAKEVKQIASNVVAELDDQRFDLSADGFTVAKARFSTQTVQRYLREDEGRIIRQADLEFEYYVQVTS